MAIKFTDLPQLSGTPSGEDVVAIVDVSEDVSKKLTISDLISAADNSYSEKVGHNPADPTDATSIVLDAKDGNSPATFKGDVINDAGNVIVDVSSPSATFSGTLLGSVSGNSTTPTGSHVVLNVGTDGSDATLDVSSVSASSVSASSVSASSVVSAHFTESVDSLSGTSVSVDPSNGSLATHTLSNSTTYSYAAGWVAGESITLHITSNGNSVTWPTTKWVGGEAPDLSGTDGVHLVNLWKIGSDVYGAYVGEAS